MYAVASSFTCLVALLEEEARVDEEHVVSEYRQDGWIYVLSIPVALVAALLFVAAVHLVIKGITAQVVHGPKSVEVSREK
jgi:hypothetical protein